MIDKRIVAVTILASLLSVLGIKTLHSAELTPTDATPAASVVVKTGLADGSGVTEGKVAAFVSGAWTNAIDAGTDASADVLASGVIGVCVQTAAANTYTVVQVDGTVTLAGVTLTQGEIYILAHVADGGIMPASDLPIVNGSAGEDQTQIIIIGTATSTSVLDLLNWDSGQFNQTS